MSLTFGRTEAQLAAAGATWTAREIAQQPTLWPEVAALAVAERAAARALLLPVIARAGRVLLSGAGSSAFVGECLAPTLARAGAPFEACATTALVADPEALAPDRPLALVSIARSGGSPESVAALDLVEQCVSQRRQLVVTCNAEGALARRARALDHARVLVLPERAHDQSFAMTSSVTSMLLTLGVLFSALDPGVVPALSAATAGLLEGERARCEQLAARGLTRVVYLGSRELAAAAREGALKLLELTDGRIVAVAETPLGFRHGPKTIVNRDTLVVLLCSNDPYTRRYDLDLLAELRRDGNAAAVLALDAQAAASTADTVALRGLAGASDLALCLPMLAFAQLFALLQALALGVRPDQPNASGTVNRVVQGVHIHRWPV